MSHFSVMIHNNKANFAMIERDSRKILLCTNNIGSYSILFIEDLQTGKQVFPDEAHRGKEPEEVLENLLQQL